MSVSCSEKELDLIAPNIEETYGSAAAAICASRTLCGGVVHNLGVQLSANPVDSLLHDRGSKVAGATVHLVTNQPISGAERFIQLNIENNSLFFRGIVESETIQHGYRLVIESRLINTVHINSFIGGRIMCCTMYFSAAETASFKELLS